MGAILNSQMADRLSQIAGAPTKANVLLDVDKRAALAPSVLEAMRQALASSLHEIYFVVLAMAVLAFVVVWFFPRGRAHELAHAAPEHATSLEKES